MVAGKIGIRRAGHQAESHRQRTATTITLSEVLNAKCRLDASSYGIDSRAAVKALKCSGLPLKTLYGKDGLCKEAHNAFRFPRIWVGKEHGVPFFSSSDIISIRPSIKGYLSKTQTKNVPKLIVKKWDVLISCSGTIGNVAIACDRLVGSALSQDSLRLRATDYETAGYVSAFLRSRYGRSQLSGSSYGSVVTHIEPDHLTRILIPDLHPIIKTDLGRKMNAAVELRDEANRLIDAADVLLHERLRLPLLSTLLEGKGETGFLSLRDSEIKMRLDGSYHNTKVQAAEKKVKSLDAEISRLDDPCVSKEILAVTKFRKRTYVESGGIPMMSSKQIFQVDPIDVKKLAKGAHQKDLKEISLKENMVVVSCSGTIGRVFIVPAYMNGWTANQHAIRITAADKFNPGYLFTWLNSDYGTCFIKRHSYGSVILEIDRWMLGSVPIPVPDVKYQNEIGDLVMKANELRDEAWRIELNAISELESIIEEKASTSQRS